MERMAFLVIFRRWVEMVRKDATRCLIIPSGLSSSIPVTFSFRQGDPVSLDLYALQKEPFLRVLRNTAWHPHQQLQPARRGLLWWYRVCIWRSRGPGQIQVQGSWSCLGTWQGREDWPQEGNWLKTEEDLKFFWLHHLSNLPADSREDLGRCHFRCYTPGPPGPWLYVREWRLPGPLHCTSSTRGSGFPSTQ